MPQSYVTGPYFCPACYSNGKKARFTEDVIVFDERGKPRCPDCGHECRTKPRASKYRENYIPSRL